MAGHTKKAISSRQRRWYLIGIGLTLMAIIFVAHSVGTRTQNPLTNLVFDTYQRILPRPYSPAPVTIVDIDEEALAQFGQWPWPRTRLADLTDRLSTAGAAAIAYDIIFAEPDRTSPNRLIPIIEGNPLVERTYSELSLLADHDEILARSFEAAPVVDGLVVSRGQTERKPPIKTGLVYSGSSPASILTPFEGAITSLPVLTNATKGTGSISLLGDNDRIVRRIQLFSRIGDQLVPSLSLEALRIAQGAKSLIIRSSDASGEISGGDPVFTSVKVGEFEIPTNELGEAWVYHTKPQPQRFISAAHVLNPNTTLRELTEKFSGHIVFVGAGATGLRDIIATPITPYEVGVTVHAGFTEQVILGQHLVRPDWAIGFERTIIILIAATIIASTILAGAIGTGALTALSIAAVVAYSWHSFSTSGFLVDPVFPVLSSIALFSVLTAYRFFQTEREKGEVRRAFSQYLSPALVERIANDPSVLKLGGEEREISILFADIRNYSSISENLSPEELTELLNRFLSPMTDTLLRHGATIDKYVGDSTIAFWNAPLATPDHERTAIEAARAMAGELRALNAQLKDQNTPFGSKGIRIGIGIASGPACVGNLGSDARFSYSAIGDTVNLAARLEGLTKQYQVQTILGENTLSGLADDCTFELDRIRVVGRKRPEKISTPVYPPAGASGEQWETIHRSHQEMLEFYRTQDWEAALAKIEVLKEDPAIENELGGYYQVMSDRITAYQLSPPGDNWDGVFTATEK